MYKIDTLKKYDINNNANYNKQVIPNTNINDLIHQDIQKIHILPPHCPLYPKEYSQFFNDNQKLKQISPYKLVNVKHPKDGKNYHKLEYNNFYTDWKKDAIKWYSHLDNEHSSIEEKQINKPNIFNDRNIKLYEQTKKKYAFAIPLNTNGTNQLNIVFDNKYVNSTFNYKRYSTNEINNKEWLNNSLYMKDISQETDVLKHKYMNDILQNSMDLYSSVFEDMYLLGYDPTEIS